MHDYHLLTSMQHKTQTKADMTRVIQDLVNFVRALLVNST
jgi:hypothetical protein